MHIYVYNTQTYIHAYTYISIYKHVHIHMHIYIHTYASFDVHIYTYVCNLAKYTFWVDKICWRTLSESFVKDFRA